MDHYNKELEKNLLDVMKEKEQADKRLLSIEYFVGIICIAVMLSLAMIASFVQMEEWLRLLLIGIGLVPLLFACPFMLKIEQTAGYYECGKCGHRYVPKYSSVAWSAHTGRTRYMRCPQCGEKSWQKKVLRRDKE